MGLELRVGIALPCSVVGTAIEVLAEKHIEANESGGNVGLVF
jgi:hypothetical protein